MRRQIVWNAKGTLKCKGLGRGLCRNMQRSREKKLEEFIVTIYKPREMRVSRIVVKLSNAKEK